MATSGDYLGGAITAREFYDAAIFSLRSCLKEENINKQGEAPRAVTEFAGALREDGFDDKDERKHRLAALEARLVVIVNKHDPVRWSGELRMTFRVQRHVSCPRAGCGKSACPVR